MTQARSFQQKIAFAKETTWGTGVNPTVTMPITDGSLIPQLPATFDDGRRGVPTQRFEALLDAGHSEGNVEGWFYPIACSHFLMGLFGTDTVSGAGDPYTHTFTLNADIPSYTVEESILSGASSGTRATGCRVGSMTFTFDAASGALEYSAQFMGKIVTVVTPQNPAIVVEQAFEGWRATVTSTDLSCKVTAGEITLTRELEVVHTGCDSKDPTYINTGPMNVEGSLTVVFDSMNILNLYLNATRQSLVISFTKGSPARSITFTMTSAVFYASPIEFDRGGIGVKARLSFTGIYNATDSGNIKVAVQNSQSAAY